MGDPDEFSAFAGMLHVFADAGAGVQHGLGLVGVADIHDAQGIASAFGQAGEVEDTGGLFAGHFAGYHGKVSLDDIVHFGGNAGGFLGRQVVGEAEVHLGLMGVDIQDDGEALPLASNYRLVLR